MFDLSEHFFRILSSSPGSSSYKYFSTLALSETFFLRAAFDGEPSGSAERRQLLPVGAVHGLELATWKKYSCLNQQCQYRYNSLIICTHDQADTGPSRTL